jgi:inner membrane protein
MDNLTHTLTGALLARAGIGRWSPGATGTLLLASNIPDSDIVASLGGALTYLEYHRTWTHALLAGPLLGLLAALCFSRLKGWRLAPAWAAGAIGVWVHILLDLLNNYGVRIWLPFRPDWVSWDLLMVVDPWLLAVLLLCVLAPALGRLVGSEIGGKAAASSPGRGWALFGLLFLLCWVGGRWVLQERAVETLRARNYHGQPPLRAAAWPTAWNPFVWHGYVSTESFWELHVVDLTREFDPERGQLFYKPEEAAVVNAARRTPEAQAFLRFAQYPVWRVLPLPDPEGATLVEATDVRFGPPEDGRFQLTIVLDAARRPMRASFNFGNPAKGLGIVR